MPFEFIGRLVGLPSYRQKTSEFVVTAQETLYKAILVLLTFTAILWMSIFLYASFYYTYMPAIAHIRPVHLQFSSCGRERGLCTYPSANVTLTQRQRLLMVGQPYRIVVEMEMPESEANQELGMFMVCVEMKDAEYSTVGRSCRSAILRYKSFLHHAITTFAFAPFLLAGSAEEKQLVTVELFPRFQEDPIRPSTDAVVEIQSQHVEIYHTYLKIHATFTGLRYFMFHWPIFAAFLGVLTNYTFISMIAFLSWYKFYKPSQVTVHTGYDANAARMIEERRAAAKERILQKEKSDMQNEEMSKTVEDEPQPTEQKSISDEKSKLEEIEEEDIIGKTSQEKEEPEYEKEDDKRETEEVKIKEEPVGDDSSEISNEVESEKVAEARTSDEFEIISDQEMSKTMEGSEQGTSSKPEEKESHSEQKVPPDTLEESGRSSKSPGARRRKNRSSKHSKTK